MYLENITLCISVKSKSILLFYLSKSITPPKKTDRLLFFFYLSLFTPDELASTQVVMEHVVAFHVNFYR